MENQTPFSREDALRQKLERLQLMHATMQPSLRGRWTRLIIRDVFGVVFFIIFWKYDWVRLLLYISVPFILLNLLILSALTWGLPRKIEKLKAELGEETV